MFQTTNQLLYVYILSAEYHKILQKPAVCIEASGLPAEYSQRIIFCRPRLHG